MIQWNPRWDEARSKDNHKKKYQKSTYGIFDYFRG
jgi:hypothetical protein